MNLVVRALGLVIDVATGIKRDFFDALAIDLVDQLRRHRFK